MPRTFNLVVLQPETPDRFPHAALARQQSHRA